MRIGLFTDAYLPEITGVTTVVRALRDELVRRGHEAYVYAPRYSRPSDDEERVFRFRSGPVFAYKTARMALPYSREATRSFRDLDVVHSHTPFSLAYVAALAARRHGLAHIQTYHTYLSALLHYVPRVLRPTVVAAESYSALLCNSCSVVTAPTQSIHDELRRFGVRRPIHVVPFGPDLRDYDGPAVWDPRAALSIAEGAPLFLYAGRIAGEKNVLFLLDGLVRIRRRLPESILVFAGDGPQRAELKHAAARLGVADAVRLLGFVDRRRLVDLYRSADVFLFASQAETQGLVLVEAMAAGTPVVAVRTVGVCDVVQDGQNGFLVARDPDALADCAVRVASEPELNARLGHGARAAAERMSLQKSVSRLLEIYDETLVDPASRWSLRPAKRHGGERGRP